MLTGQRFKLTKATISVHTVGGERDVVMVPAGAIVEVISGPKPDDRRMLDVLWDSKVLVMFVEDIKRRGEQIRDKAAEA